MSDDKDIIEEEEEESSSSPDKKKKSNPRAKTDGKTDAKKKQKRKGSRVARWFREMRSELKKVTWPTPRQVTNNTLVALVIMVAAAVVIWGVDQVASTIFEGIRTALSFGGGNG